MKTNDIQSAAKFLNDNGIEYTQTETGILVNRDSICAKISGKDENTCYSNFITMLNLHFGSRYTFVGKTDEWLMLDKIS